MITQKAEKEIVPAKEAAASPLPPSGRVREYFEHFSALNMLELLLGLVLSLFELYNLISLTYTAIWNSSVNLAVFGINFLVLVLGLALMRSAGTRAAKRYLRALVK